MEVRGEADEAAGDELEEEGGVRNVAVRAHVVQDH